MLHVIFIICIRYIIYLSSEQISYIQYIAQSYSHRCIHVQLLLSKILPIDRICMIWVSPYSVTHGSSNSFFPLMICRKCIQLLSGFHWNDHLNQQYLKFQYSRHTFSCCVGKTIREEDILTLKCRLH